MISNSIRTARGERIFLALFIALILTTLFMLLSDPVRSGTIVRGDFPSFYGAARIVLEGKGAALYSSEVQSEVQNRFFPELNGYLYFAYPPFVALLLSPLGMVTPEIAKCVWVLFQIVCLVVSSRILAEIFRDSGLTRRWIFLVAVTFPPLFHSLIAGQNSAVSLLIAVSQLSLLRKENSTRNAIMLGMLVGAWMFKVHFALLSLALLLGLRGRRVLIGFSFVALVEYILSLFLDGASWPLDYLQAANWFAMNDIVANGYQMVSIPAMAAWILSHLDQQMPEITRRAIGDGILAACIGAAGFGLFRMRIYFSSEMIFVAFLSILPVLSPHTLYYDLAFVIPALLYARVSERALLALFAVSLAGITLKEQITAFPLALICLLLVMILFRQNFKRVEAKGSNC